MKTAIVYATKYGCTKKCVDMLQACLPGKTDVFLAMTDHFDPDLYDVIFIGGSVYMGKIRKQITQFCRRYLNQLLKKKVGLFVCCCTPNGTEGFLETLFPPELLRHASLATCVGGETDYRKMNFFYRKLLQLLRKSDEFNKRFSVTEIDKKEIEKLANIINP